MNLGREFFWRTKKKKNENRRNAKNMKLFIVF